MIDLAIVHTNAGWISALIFIWIIGGILAGLLSTYPSFRLTGGETFAVAVLWPFVLIAGLIWCVRKVARICGQLIGIN